MNEFQLLSTLCHADNQTVEDNLELFYQTEFIYQQVLSRQSFEIQIDLIVEQFKRTIPKSFQSTLELIQLMSTLECLYNDSCLFQIKVFINSTALSTNFTTLNLSSEYNANNSYDSIEILDNKLFIQS
jgi:hypothetical protein